MVKRKRKSNLAQFDASVETVGILALCPEQLIPVHLKVRAGCAFPLSDGTSVHIPFRISLMKSAVFITQAPAVPSSL
ncbi:MAG: hypothetical protein MR681_09845 [Prevotella sp.]|nr:hypothetical protein [Prevotella sp.]